MCETLRVSPSGYYLWLRRKISQTDAANRVLDVHITSLYRELKGRYGSPRITKALNRANIHCGQNRVASRMKALKLQAKAKRKFKVTTDSSHKLPVFENILNRDFLSESKNQKWVSDITYIRTKEGWLHLAVVIDLYSRAVVGWSMSDRINKGLVCDTLTMALFRRQFPKRVIVHSDRGSQYYSNEYKDLLKKNDLIGSMSRKDNCWDNSPCESFFHTLKVELIGDYEFATRREAKQKIFSYIESNYNKKRMHSSIDYMTPHDMECAA